MKYKIVGIYSTIHFIVDLACAILVTNLVTQRMGQGMPVSCHSIRISEL